MATLKPKPGWPRRLILGTLQSSNMSEHVEEPRIPSLSSFFPISRPWIGFGTMMADMPLCFRFLSVVARTMAASLSKPLVIHDLVPFRIQSEPSDLAVVEAAPASEPFPGSERAKQPT